jgi:hypothetical protein
MNERESDVRKNTHDERRIISRSAVSEDWASLEERRKSDVTKRAIFYGCFDFLNFGRCVSAVDNLQLGIGTPSLITA